LTTRAEAASVSMARISVCRRCRSDAPSSMRRVKRLRRLLSSSTFWNATPPPEPRKRVLVPSEDRGHSPTRWPVVVALVLLTAGAGALRFWGLGFGLPSTMARPDEEAITATAAHIVLYGPDPKFFDYPTLFMYLVAFVERVWPGGSPVFDDIIPTMIARTVAATLGTLSIPLLFVTARAILPVPTALTAAALLAVAFLHVRDSHFGVTDVPMTFMVLLAFFVIVSQRLDRAHWWNVALAALLCGLAASTKYNALVIVVPLGVAMMQARAPSWMYLLAGTLFAAGFLAGTPYAVITPRSFVAGLVGLESHLMSGHGTDEGFGWMHHLTFSLRYGLGVVFLVTALAGAAWLAWSGWRRGLMVLSFPVLYYVGMGSGRTVFMRHMTPIVPFMALFAAIAIGAGANAVRRGSGAGWAAAAVLCALTIGIGFDSGMRAIELDRLLSQRDSRAIAADIVHERYFPRGASIYQNGTVYGRVKPWPEGLYPELPIDRSPKLAILHTSHLVAYRDEPAEVRDVLAKRYRLLRRIDVETPSTTATPVFDQQDAFFVPVAGFASFERPGPTIEIYERVDR
jgi:Dolichyl-phosphate-mannose-protein mannosyltransferase